LLFAALIVAGCSGSRKYFKAAEKLEKQGLVNEAANYYLESLQRKPTNVEARIKLKEVGQKYMSNMASEFFRNYNTQQLEASLESYERLKEFDEKTSLLDVKLDYPKTYDDDYQKAVDTYCSANYNKAYVLVNQKHYNEALTYIRKIEKYNKTYKNTQQLSIVATCEPLYQSAIASLENKNYNQAFGQLETIKSKTENYKDAKDLLELAKGQMAKSLIMLPPPNGSIEKDVEDYLFSNFNQVALQKLDKVRIINNTPFQSAGGATTDLSNTNNIDLVQAIRKATGADYFYVFDVSNKREYNSGISKTTATGFQEVKVRKNDTLIITEYRPFDYNVVKAQRSFSYDFVYKVINAYTNQIVSSQTQNIRSQDGIEYQEFQRPFNGNINTLFPYNPQNAGQGLRLSPVSWRSQFSARSTLKLMDELKADAFNRNINMFLSSVSNLK
jgi:hypothetical protein